MQAPTVGGDDDEDVRVEAAFDQAPQAERECANWLRTNFTGVCARGAV